MVKGMRSEVNMHDFRETLGLSQKNYYLVMGKETCIKHLKCFLYGKTAISIFGSFATNLGVELLAVLV